MTSASDRAHRSSSQSPTFPDRPLLLTSSRPTARSTSRTHIMTSVAKSAAQAKGHPALVPNFTLADYTSFAIAGALCCTVTHGAMTPIDVVKTRIQIDPDFKKQSLLSGGRKLVAAEGASALLTGFGPTAVGYLVQGGAKFAGYEFWKKQFVQIAGDQENAVKYRTAIYLGASSVAECVVLLSLLALSLVSERRFHKMNLFSSKLLKFIL